MIGPDLFPLYTTILAIVLAASIGGQLVALAVSMVVAGNTVNYLETFWGLFNSLPVSIGFVTLVFYLLQRFEVKPEPLADEFDPYDLPPVVESESVSRGEHLFGILFGAAFLAVLTWFFGPGGGGRTGSDVIFIDPIIERYFFWVAASILAGILVDILLLWRGGWSTATRLLRLVVNVFSLGVLTVLIRAHAAWLTDAGLAPSIAAFGEAAARMGEGIQLIVMLSIWLALVVAALATLIQTVVYGYKLVRGVVRSTAPEPMVIKVQR